MAKRIYVLAVAFTDDDPSELTEFVEQHPGIELVDGYWAER